MYRLQREEQRSNISSLSIRTICWKLIPNRTRQCYAYRRPFAHGDTWLPSINRFFRCWKQQFNNYSICSWELDVKNQSTNWNYVINGRFYSVSLNNEGPTLQTEFTVTNRQTVAMLHGAVCKNVQLEVDRMASTGGDNRSFDPSRCPGNSIELINNQTLKLIAVLIVFNT